MGTLPFHFCSLISQQGLTKKQKDQSNYLRAAIGCDEKTALDLLRKTNWDVDRACELHFGDPKNQEKSKPKSNKKQEEMFEKYKGQFFFYPIY